MYYSPMYPDNEMTVNIMEGNYDWDTLLADVSIMEKSWTDLWRETAGNYWDVHNYLTNQYFMRKRKGVAKYKDSYIKHLNLVDEDFSGAKAVAYEICSDVHDALFWAEQHVAEEDQPYAVFLYLTQTDTSLIRLWAETDLKRAYQLVVHESGYDHGIINNVLVSGLDTELLDSAYRGA